MLGYCQLPYPATVSHKMYFQDKPLSIVIPPMTDAKRCPSPLIYAPHTTSPLIDWPDCHLPCQTPFITDDDRRHKQGVIGVVAIVVGCVVAAGMVGMRMEGGVERDECGLWVVMVGLGYCWWIAKLRNFPGSNLPDLLVVRIRFLYG